MSTFYMFCFLLSFLLSLMYVYKWNDHFNEHITLLFMIIPLGNYGYWEFSVAKSVEQAALGIKMTYIGGCYAPLMIMLSIFALCQIQINKKIQLLFYMITGGVFCSSLTIGHNKFFYKGLVRRVVDGRNVFIKEYNVAHTVFYIMLICYLLIGIASLLYSLSRRKEVSKTTIILLLIVDGVTLFTFAGGRFLLGKDLVPACLDVALFILLIISDRLGMYNVNETVVHAMIQRGDIGVISFDLKHRFLGCNDKAKEFYPPVEMLRVDRRVSEKEPELRQLREWIRQVDLYMQMDALEKRGDRYYKISADFVFEKSHFRGYHFLITDCTDERKYEELLKQQADAAMQASEAKGRFLANMSHEIRTPINAVLGLDTMILRESKESQIREYAVDIENAGQSLLALVNDILDFSKIESGKMEIIPLEYDFSSLIHDVVGMMSMKARDKELELKLELDEKLPAGLYGDDVRIRQVLINILSNAVKYTEKGSVVLSVAGVVEGDSVLLHFAVKDTGIGIKQEDIGKLFSAFERIEEKRNRNIEGTGLGMNITIQLLALMGSKLDVESVYGEGSTFSFDLRQEIRNAEPIGDLQERISKQAKSYTYVVSCVAPDAKILVVDDNAMNRRVFGSLLKQTQVQIDEACDGKEALELAAKNSYDIIFLDHMMPGLDGIEVRQQMLSWKDYPNKNTPVIALTANAVTGAKEQYLAAGFDDYLSKPINPDKLEQMLFDLLPEEKKKQQAVSEDKAVPQEEELPQIDGVDWDYALLKLKDISLVKGVVKDFSVMAESDLQELAVMAGQLKQAYEEEEKEQAFDAYRVKVHAMKTTAAMFGATNVSSIARLLEYAARDKESDTIWSLHDIFSKEWLKLKESLDNAFELNSGKQQDRLQIEPIMLKQYLTMLRAAMEELDTDTADAIVEELQQYAFNKNASGRLKALAVAVRNLDIEGAVNLLDEWNEEVE